MENIKKIHFIGIGGIGLSGLARYAHKRGIEISGSDVKQTLITDSLIKEGISVSISHNKNNINNQDLVVYTSITLTTNPELQEALRLGIKTLSRKDFLPFILKNKKVYSVCGAHGKSTTSAILSAIYEDDSAIIGAETKSFGSNMRYKANSDKIIFEADESDKSFLNSNPYCAIVTNAELEHMDAYDYDEEHFYQCYRDFVKKAKYAVVNIEDEFLASLEGKHITRLNPSTDISNIKYQVIGDEPYTSFKLLDLGVFNVWGLGEFIAVDASLAILSALKDYDVEVIRENIKNFKGIKKRFDILNNSKAVVIDDYGHHPTEIKVTLSSVKKYANMRNVDKVTAIWQPHKYSRTIDNMNSFQQCFADSDELIILPVWSAGEEIVQIDFETSFKKYKPLFADKVSVNGDNVLIMKKNKVIKKISQGLVVGFGAGDITYQLRGA